MKVKTDIGFQTWLLFVHSRITAFMNHILLFLALAACTSSQEWTITQTVQELHLVRLSAFIIKALTLNEILTALIRVFVCQAVLGGLCSGKSALVHRHLTGSYLSLENAEGRLGSHSNHFHILFMTDSLIRSLTITLGTIIPSVCTSSLPSVFCGG